MPEWMKDPGVVTGVVALIGALFVPMINGRIKRRENGRLEALKAEAARVEATERNLKVVLERQDAQIVALTKETDALADEVNKLKRESLRTAQKYDRVLAAILGFVRQVHDELVRDDRTAAIARTREALDAIETARGSLFKETA